MPADIPLDGWCGQVYQVSGSFRFVQWHWATLEVVHAAYSERCRQDDTDLHGMWLRHEWLEADLVFVVVGLIFA